MTGKGGAQRLYAKRRDAYLWLLFGLTLIGAIIYTTKPELFEDAWRWRLFVVPCLAFVSLLGHTGFIRRHMRFPSAEASAISMMSALVVVDTFRALSRLLKRGPEGSEGAETVGLLLLLVVAFTALVSAFRSADRSDTQPSAGQGRGS